MKKLIIFIFILTPVLIGQKSFKDIGRTPSSDPDFDRAISMAQKAILKMPTIKKYKNTLEKKTYGRIRTYTGIQKEDLALALPIIKTLADQKISTEGVKINWRFTEGGNLKPHLEYDFKEDKFKSSVQLNWEF